MKALVYTGPESLEFRDAPKPTAQPGEELVRIEAVGICGSDMHAYLGHDARRPAPLILGHEGAGVIEGGPRDGQRVTINPLVHCGHCPACREGRQNICPDRQIISMPPREGAFAQYVAIVSENLTEVPDDVPIEKAALAEPLAVCWHAARLGLAAAFDPGSVSVAILGGGAIGLGTALSLRAMGVDRITICEPNTERATYLRQTGENVVEDLDLDEFSLVVDAVGLAVTRKTASAIVSPGGVIVHIGLAEDEGGLDVRRMTLQEITFIGTYTYTPEDFDAAAQAIFDGRLGPLDWFAPRPLSEGATAFAEIKAGKVAVPKIVLIP